MSQTTVKRPAARKALKRRFHHIAKYRGAVELGWNDYMAPFRRSFFGPLWAPFQLAVWIAVLTLIFGRTLGGSHSSYAIYLALGLYSWEFLSASLVQGPAHFISQSRLIKNVPVDISYLTIRKVSQFFARGLFQLPVPLILLFVFGHQLNAKTLLLAPVPIIFAVFMYASFIILGVVGAYFRDFRFLMQSMTRFFFFTTPIIWYGDVGVRKTISTYNPFSYFIELVRAPLNGEYASSMAWLVACGLTAIALLAAIWVQKAFRQRLIYWL